MENGLTASDIAVMTHKDDGFGSGNTLIWIFALLLLAGGGLGGFRGDYGNYASAASQQEILFGQRFNSIDDKIDRGFTNVFNGISDATFAVNNAVKDGNYATQAAIKDCCCTTQRNTDALRYDMAQGFANANANTTAQTQKILDALAQNKIDSLTQQVATLTNQLNLQQAVCGVPKISPYMYGVVPNYNGCGCGNI